MKIKEGGVMDIQEKKAFEIAFDKKLGAHCCQFDLDEDGNYEDRDTLCGWHMWLEAKANAVLEWIETAIQPPEEGQKVIISGIYGVGIAEFSYLYKDEFVMYDMGASNPILSKDQVKFWQPLPDAPQEPAND